MIKFCTYILLILGPILVSISCVDSEQCPATSSRQGSSPPKGNAVFCRKIGAFGARIKHGPYVEWHQNGKMKKRGMFHEGSKVGTWTTWHANGLKALEGRYDQGVAVGVWRKWDEQGNALEQADPPPPDKGRDD